MTEPTENPLKINNALWYYLETAGDGPTVLDLRKPLGPAQTADTVPVLPNWDDGHEGEEGGESKAGTDELFHGELIELVIQYRCHHPRHCQGQL